MVGNPPLLSFLDSPVGDKSSKGTYLPAQTTLISIFNYCAFAENLQKVQYCAKYGLEADGKGSANPSFELIIVQLRKYSFLPAVKLGIAF